MNGTRLINFEDTTVQFAALFCICLVLCSFIGFPVVVPDSRRYLGGAAVFQMSHEAPTLFPFLLRPLYLLFGPWAFVVANCALAAFVSIHITRIFTDKFLLITPLLSLLVSMMLLNMTFVMMDVQAVFGVLLLMVILFQKNNLLVKFILGLCVLSHNSSLLILGITMFLVAIIVRDKKFIFNCIVVLACSILCLSFYNYKLEGRFSPLPDHASQFLVAKLIVDTPEAMDGYIAAYPESAFSSHWNDFKNKHQDQFGDDDGALEHLLLWDKDGLLMSTGKDNLSMESGRFVTYVLTHYTAHYIATSLKNFMNFFLRFDRGKYAVEAFSSWNGYDFHDFADQYFPSQKDDILLGAQHANRLQFFYVASITTPVFILALIFNLLVIVSYCVSSRCDYRMFVLSVIAVVFFLTNAFVSANFGINTSGGRFFVRAFWPLILNMFLCMECFYRNRKSLHGSAIFDKQV